MTTERGRPDSTATDLATLINHYISKRLQGTHTALPANVVSYNHSAGTATVQPALRLLLIDDSERRMPPIEDVPVLMQATGSAIARFTLEAGDPVMLLFSERGMSNFRETLEEGSPDRGVRFSLNDAVVLAGGFYRPDHYTETATNRVSTMKVENIEGDSNRSKRDPLFVYTPEELSDDTDRTLPTNVEVSYSLQNKPETAMIRLIGGVLRDEAGEPVLDENDNPIYHKRIDIIGDIYLNGRRIFVEENAPSITDITIPGGRRERTSAGVSVTIAAPDDERAVYLRYRVAEQSDGTAGEWSTTEKQTQTAITNFELSSLEPGTEYHVQVWLEDLFDYTETSGFKHTPAPPLITRS